MELTAFLPLLAQVLLIIALPVVIAAAIQVFRVQSNRLRAAIGEERFNALKDIVRIAVQAAERLGVIEGLTGPEKRAQAVRVAQALLSERGIRVDVARLVSLVEAEVQSQLHDPVVLTQAAGARQSLIDRAVEAAVLAAEQSGLEGIIQNIGAEKKAYAMQMVTDYLNQHRLSAPADLISGLIEAQLLRFRLAARSAGTPSRPGW